MAAKKKTVKKKVKKKTVKKPAKKATKRSLKKKPAKKKSAKKKPVAKSTLTPFYFYMKIRSSELEKQLALILQEEASGKEPT
ncbi:MAG: hypothetical protein NWP78_00360, partial [Ilumatobacteraceae bacterium]|nr:hypothetical protein [Ilumatobacteraceae bacterium]